MASQMGFIAGLVFLLAACAVVVRSEPNGTCSTIGQLLPDENSCLAFYKCDNFQNPVLERCPLGLCYDETKQYCDYPYNVPCCYNQLKSTTVAEPTRRIQAEPARRIPAQPKMFAAMNKNSRRRRHN